MELFDSALHFAAERHSGQRRKGGDLPFILHPIEVAAIAATMTEDQEVLAAAILHDTVEDTATTLQELRDNFGERVAALVETETENKRRDIDASLSWLTRKEESLIVLRNSTDPAVHILWLSDKLANMRSFYRQHLQRGDAMWEAYHQKDPAMHAAYYRKIADCVSDLCGTPAYEEYIRLIDLVFEEQAD